MVAPTPEAVTPVVVAPTSPAPQPNPNPPAAVTPIQDGPPVVFAPGWTDQDIGVVAAKGSAKKNDVMFSMGGSGADIVGTADGFHYAYQQVSGDCTIIARVATQSAVRQKSGIMIRSDLSPGSISVSLVLRSNLGVLMDGRAVKDGASTNIGTDKSQKTPPIWLKLTRAGNIFTGYASLDGTSWTPQGSITLPNMGSSAYIGLVECAISTTGRAYCTFDSVTVTPGEAQTAAATPTPTAVPASPPVTPAVVLPASPTTTNVAAPTPPAPPSIVPPKWSAQDIGSPELPGSTIFDNGTFTLKGSGRGIWSKTDAFHFAAQPVTGDCSIIARLVKTSATRNVAGVMIRENLTPDCRLVILALTQTSATVVEFRDTPGGPMQAVAAGSPIPAPAPTPGAPPAPAATTPPPAATTTQKPPLWLKLTRVGNTFTGYDSQDGVTWTQVGTPVTSVTIAPTVYIGLAECPINRLYTGTAIFDSVSITPASP
jgi:hypothetical protein